MSTSLALQLKRLQAPQTGLLHDNLHRASLLFDPKEAAEKDRETIYEIGISGLEDLISLNPSFVEFETSLFDISSRDLQRAVETVEVNETLNKSLRKFILQLSPYFLLQSAHKCLEWLIRRYQIHTFNKDLLIALILPYHETRIFVRCIQILQLRDDRDEFHFLERIKKPGVPLPKQTLFNQAAGHPTLLRFIGKTVLDSVKVLKNRASSLQTLFAFYCTTTIGAIHTAGRIDENHIINILPALLKGLKSEVLDFTAAAYMITGQLLVQGTFDTKLVTSILERLVVCQHLPLQSEAMLLICLMFNHHDAEITSTILSSIVSNRRFSTILGEIDTKKFNIIPFLTKLNHACLAEVQTSGDFSTEAKTLLQNLANDVIITDDEDAEAIILGILDSYIFRREKDDSAQDIDAVIDLDSDEEMAESRDVDITKWYSGYLKNFEKQYPVAFDRVVKSIMTGNDKRVTLNQRKSLKSVLGVILQITYADNDTNIFESLYHRSATQRVRAVKYIAENLSKINLNEDGRDLIRESLLERLNDDSPGVVDEVLKIKGSNLIEMINRDEITTKIFNIIAKCVDQGERWHEPMASIIDKIDDGDLFGDDNHDRLFVHLFPMLFPTNKPEVIVFKRLLKTKYASSNKFLKQIKEDFKDAMDVKAILELVHKVLEKLRGNFGDFDVYQKIVNESFQQSQTKISFFYNTLLLSSVLPASGSIEKSRQLIEVVFRQAERITTSRFVNDSLIQSHKLIREGILSVQVITRCLSSIMSGTDFSVIRPDDDFSSAGEDSVLGLSLKILEIVIEKLFKASSSEEVEIYSKLIKENLFDELDDNVEFFCQFFVGTKTVRPEFQARVIKLLIELTRAGRKLNEIRMKSICHVLIGLNSPFTTIRQLAVEFLTELEKAGASTELLGKVLARNEEILMDREQVSLILFTLLEKRSSFGGMKLKIIDLIVDESTPAYLSAGLLEVMKHINDKEIFERLIGLSGRILNSVQDDSKTLLLDKYRGAILRHILVRINPATISIISTEQGSSFIEKVVGNYKTLVSCEGRLKSPSTILLEILTPECFEKLTVKPKKLLINAMISAATFDDNVMMAAKKLFGKTEMDASIIEHILNEMKTVKPIGQSDKRKSLQTVLTIPTEILTTNEWRMGMTLLEFIQNKINFKNTHRLIPLCFDILKICLNFEEQSPVEYTKQLVLSAILLGCESLPSECEKRRRLIPDKSFFVEDIVRCIRATQNPQTHHHALILLCHMATIIPDQVLHNIMDIFTFMGSSVVRHDDAYSFQIIIKIIETVIPILTKSDTNMPEEERQKLVIPILKIFALIALDVPEHRRIPLYTKLLKTLGGRTYLWMFLGVLFENLVAQQEKEKKKTKEEPLARRMEIALSITQEFEVDIVLETCANLLEYLRKLPANIPEKPSNPMDVDGIDEEIFFLNVHSGKQFRHFKYVTLQFIGMLTSSPILVNQIAVLDQQVTREMKTFYQNLIIKILMYIPEVSKISEQAEPQQQKYWKVLLYHCYDILDNAVTLLSVDIFLLVVHGLVQHKILAVRKRVIDLFVTKIHYNDDFVDKCDRNQLLEILKQLHIIVKLPIKDDIAEIQQISLIAIKILSKILSEDYPEPFKPILIDLTEILRKDVIQNRNLRATVVLCLGEICVNLKAHSLSELSKFMPLLIVILKEQIGSTANNPLFISTITSLQKIIDTIPQFLSPYLVKMIITLAEASVSIPTSDDKLSSRLNLTFNKISSSIPGRILIPAIEKCYQILIQKSMVQPLKPVMKIISTSFDHIPSDEMKTLQAELSNFFMSTLEFRSGTETNFEVTDIETDVIKAFVRLVLKLSESSFRPLYMKIYDWALRDSPDDNKERAITFYNLSSHIAESLKSIFTLFAGHFIQNSADLLNQCNPAKLDAGESLYFPDSDQNVIALTEHILKTLYLVCLHDTQNFINAHRFSIIMLPIVDQIENPLLIGDERRTNLIAACISQLAVVINDDSLWKQLNYQVLLKTRTNNHKIRLNALKVCLEIAKKLGPNYLPFLPETIPFLAELLEDENQEVERACQKAVQEMEKVVGESLQKYF